MVYEEEAMLWGVPKDAQGNDLPIPFRCPGIAAHEVEHNGSLIWLCEGHWLTNFK